MRYSLHLANYPDSASYLTVMLLTVILASEEFLSIIKP
jgi:hypothetical protein